MGCLMVQWKHVGMGIAIATINANLVICKFAADFQFPQVTVPFPPIRSIPLMFLVFFFSDQ